MYFIIGASSFIGRHLYEYCKKRQIDVLGTYYAHSHFEEWIKFDICSDNLSDIIRKYCDGKIPSAVILCSAITSIDGCKKDENASNALNVLGIKRVLEQIDKMGTKSVFLSSEAVFDGKRGLYLEEDSPNPVTAYGRQKLQIEQYMIKYLKNYIIFRISRAASSHYGEPDIFDEFYKKIVSQEEIICLKGQSFCLTEVDDIARGIIKALECNLNGLYHLSSANYISRYELAHLFAKKIFGGYDRILEKEYKDIHFSDNRHIYAGLKGDKLAGLLDVQYTSIMEMLDRYKDSCEAENIKRGIFTC